jgi:hypothetical protein
LLNREATNTNFKVFGFSMEKQQTSILVFGLLNGEATNTNFLVFGLT